MQYGMDSFGLRGIPHQVFIKKKEGKIMSLAWWKRELFGGWTHFEAVWLLMFLGIQAVVFVFNPDSWLASVAAVRAKSAIICSG